MVRKFESRSVLPITINFQLVYIIARRGTQTIQIFAQIFAQISFKLTIRRRSSFVKVLTTIVSRTVFENFLHLGIKSKIVSIFFELSNINDFICSILVIEAFRLFPKIKNELKSSKNISFHPNNVSKSLKF